MSKSRNIEVGKHKRRPLPGNGSSSVFPLQPITKNKINLLPKKENTFPLQRTETELLDSEATLAKAELKTKENPWTRCSRISPRSSTIRGESSTLEKKKKKKKKKKEKEKGSLKSETVKYGREYQGT
jgi:hypothetical protein